MRQLVLYAHHKCYNRWEAKSRPLRSSPSSPKWSQIEKFKSRSLFPVVYLRMGLHQVLLAIAIICGASPIDDMSRHRCILIASEPGRRAIQIASGKAMIPGQCLENRWSSITNGWWQRCKFFYAASNFQIESSESKHFWRVEAME
jgi:hypothetical protein